jgi:hypothetical protein
VFRTVVTEHDLVLGQVIVDELRKVLKRKLRLQKTGSWPSKLC